MTLMEGDGRGEEGRKWNALKEKITTSGGLGQRWG